MINPMDLQGRRILVTGASSGIGRETAILLSRLGARLILVGRDKERLAQTESRLEGQGHCAQAFDLTEVAAIPNWMRVLTAGGEVLHGLVHSAGVDATRPLNVLSPEVLSRTLRINLEAAVGLLRGFRQKGVHCKNGSSVVLLASVMALVGQPGVAAYSATKGALVALARSVALELAGDHIRVNCVAPGHVKTEMAETLRQKLSSEQFAALEARHPLGIGTALDVAYSIAFLLADTGRWITGTTLVVDGGYTAH